MLSEQPDAELLKQAELVCGERTGLSLGEGRS